MRLLIAIIIIGFILVLLLNGCEFYSASDTVTEVLWR